MGRHVIALPDGGPITVSEDNQGRSTLIIDTQPVPDEVVKVVQSYFPRRDVEPILMAISDVQLEGVFRDLIRGS